MKGWPTVSLGAIVEVTDYVANGSFESLRVNVSYSVVPEFAVLVRLVDHNSGWARPFTYVNKGSYEFLKKSSLAPGDVVVANVGANAGTVFRVPDLGMPMTLGPNAVLCRPRNRLEYDRDYMYYFLSSPAGQSLIESIVSGSAQPKFNKTGLRQLPVPVPPIAHQRAIAQGLGALDDKIATNAKTMQLARNLAESMFARAVGHEGDEVVLGDVTSLLTRGVTPRYAESADAAVILNQKCIRDRRVNLGPARRTERGSVKQAKWLLQNDVLVNSTGLGTLGRVARWTLHSEATADSHVSILRFDASCVEPVCAGYAVLGLEDLIEQMGEGSTGQTELSRAELGKVTLRVPGKDKQADIGRRLSDLSDLTDGLCVESDNLAQIRDALLPRLMSGQIRVKDAELMVGDVV